MQSVNFEEVTELPGSNISSSQLRRMYNRYHWTAKHCVDKDVLEVACGAGQGVGYVSRVAKSVVAGDYCDSILQVAREHYKDRFEFLQFDAQKMPFEDRCFDVVVMHEALYYLPSAEKFICEAARVLRSGGTFLLTNSNKDLPDFNPSKYSTEYHGVIELRDLLERNGFSTSFFGSEPLAKIGFKEKVLRPIKWIAVKLHLIPKTMKGKQLLRRFIFGPLEIMPVELTPEASEVEELSILDSNRPCRDYKIIYCTATLQS